VLPAVNDGPQWLARVDHYPSERHHFSWRYSYDSRHVLPTITVPNGVLFPGFVQEDTYSHHNFLLADSYTFGSSTTNEFRFSYGRPDVRLAGTWSGSVPLARTLPLVTIEGVSAPGLNSGNEQSHNGANFLFQETQTRLRGRHTFRYGLEFVRQLITQQKAGNILGNISFRPSVDYSSFANFLDNYSGPSAMAGRVFGANVFHPDQFHQSYFFQDIWKPAPALTLTLGLRYENFGQVANSLPYPAFPGFDPARFLVRQEVTTDNNDFGPALGLAWSPDEKTIWRGGYQISYDSLPTQLISQGPATSTPNAISTAGPPVPNSGRGLSNWFEQLPMAAGTPSLTDSRSAVDKDLRYPYTERWSFGFQRQLPQSMLFDVAYVGSESHRLITKADRNPRLPVGVLRVHPDFGAVEVRTSEGNSSYHALQARVDRRFAHGLQFAASYTWSRSIDSASDGMGGQSLQDADKQYRPSVPISQGGLRLDRGVSDFDRTHRMTITYLWAVPEPRRRSLKNVFGGWQIGGITTFQSGTPFTVANGMDRNNDLIPADRPDIGNPRAPLTTRANISNTCATGYQNPDSGLCIGPGEVHWVEGTGFPNASTVGRNTLRTGGTNNFDLNVTKPVLLGESRRLELRWEALNAFNHPQFIQVPPMMVNGAPAGRFLNRDFSDSGIRSMWVQVKLVF
jgi:hypothetical protein